MGGDFAPDAIVEGAVNALSVIDDKITLIGAEEKILDSLKKHSYDESRIAVVNASEIIETNEPPVKAIKTKKDSSIVKGMHLLKDKQGDALISAGNTGALMAGGIFILGRIPNIDRPAIGSIYPVVQEGKFGLLIDAGANSEVKPKNLLEFATMGSVYLNRVMGVENPKIGLVNMGAEPNKGSLTLKNAYELLTNASDGLGTINFIGNVEARDLPLGVCDVIVCDGYVGNVILKLTEGLGYTLLNEIKTKFTEGLSSKIGAMLLKKKLYEIKKMTDYSEYGGAPILGVNFPLIKAHGSSNAKAITSAIKASILYVKNDAISTITNTMQEIEKIEVLLD